jgi:putative ABC transport system permease protein
MKILLRKLFIDIKKTWVQYMAITLISMIGVMLLSGMSVVYLTLSNTVNNFYDECNLADITVAYYGGIDEKGVNNIKSLDGVSSAEGRIKLTAESNDDDSSFLVKSISNSTKIDKVIIQNGRMPKDDTECLVNTRYAQENKLSIGDKINVKINDSDYKLSISGTCMDAEYAYLVKNSAESMIPDFKNYGLLFIHDSMIKKIAGGTFYNEVVVKATPNSNCNNIINDIKNTNKDFHFSSAKLRKDQQSFVKLDSDISTARSMAKIFPYIFFLVAAAIIFITMSRTVQNEIGQIGIMKALGISNFRILSQYFAYSISSCLVGGIVGNVLGIIFLPMIQFKNYTLLYMIPELKLYGYLNYVICSIAVVLLFGIIASYLSARKALKSVPAQCIRNMQTKKARKIWLEKRKFVWNHLSHKSKLICRNIFFNKRRALLSSLGIIGCVGLLLCGFGLKDSTERFIQMNFDKIQKYDAMVAVNRQIMWNDETKLKEKDIRTCDKVSIIPVMLNSVEDYSTSLYVLDKDNQSIQLYDTSGNKISLPEEGAIIPYKLVRDYGLKVGDIITLTLQSDAYDFKKLKIKVAGISELYVSQDIYISEDYFESLDTKPSITGYYITFNDNADSDSIIKQLKDEDITASVSVKSKLKAQFDTLYQSTKTTVYLLIIMSACLALMVIFNISAINIYERSRDLATLKVLGYHKKELNSLIYVENIAITVWGIFWGVIFGILIYKQILLSSESISMYYPFRITASMVLFSVVLTFIFTAIANFLLKPKINSIDMVESLKSVE